MINGPSRYKNPLESRGQLPILYDFGLPKLDVKLEKGVILVVYKKPGRSPRYAVLNRKKNWEGWELPKGHLEEDYEDTVVQELQEEAGINEEQVESVEELDRNIEWTFKDDGEEIQRKYRAFLVKVEDTAHIDVRNNPHDEHEKGHFFNFSDSKSLLTYDNQKELLEEIHQEHFER